jgi:hypothetical protein
VREVEGQPQRRRLHDSDSEINSGRGEELTITFTISFSRRKRVASPTPAPESVSDSDSFIDMETVVDPYSRRRAQVGVPISLLMSLSESANVEASMILDFVVNRVMVVKINMCIYVYCAELGQWYNLYSPEAANVLANRLDINAPVNYSVALARYYKTIAIHCPSISRLPISVCIYNRRNKFEITSEGKDTAIHFDEL